jgi:hypothetical protein
MQVSRFLICILILGTGACALVSKHAGSPGSLWSWYWNDHAQLLVSQHGIGAVAGIDNFIDSLIAGIWNPLMQFEIVRVAYLLLIAGSVFGIGMQLVSFAETRRATANGATDTRELNEYLRWIQEDRSRLLADIEQTKSELARLSAAQTHPVDSEKPAWLQEAHKDPNSALTEFRRQVELKLRAAATRISPDLSQRNLNVLMKTLQERGIISEFYFAILSSLRKELNAAAHTGIESPQTQELLLSMAPDVLAYLDSI